MGMGWEKVVGMKLKPYSCVACGQTGEMTEDGPPEAYFAQGVDVNWGDSVYLCGTCVRILGELRGMLDVEAVNKLTRERDKLRKELDETTESHDELQSKVNRMLDGARARKEAKEVVKS